MAWHQSGSRVGMSLFFTKLSSLHNRLRKWSKEEFGNIFAQVKSVAESYKQREVEFNSSGEESSKIQLHEAKAMYLRELSVECKFWRQKATLRWIKEGDANTSYFYYVVKQRRISNDISRVKNEGLGWLQETVDIKASAVRC